MSCQWFLEKEVCAFVGARCKACVYILLLQYITVSNDQALGLWLVTYL
jgi:hypothetical protein